MKPQVVIAMYRPKAGREGDLLALVRRHVPTLRRLGLATERPVTLLRSFQDGTLLEIFEWRSVDAARDAHERAEVGEIWGALEEASEFRHLGGLPEAGRPFPHFEAVDGVVA